MMECDWEPLGLDEISGILPKEGLGKLSNPLSMKTGDIVTQNMRRMKLDTHRNRGKTQVARKLHSLDVPLSVCPKR